MKIQCRLAVVLFGSSALTVCAATRYVWQSSPGPAPPYNTWATAATNIQNAVDAAGAGDEIVVTNGTYATGVRVVYSWMIYSWMTNRVAVDKPLLLRSVNGPEATVIDGGSAVRCVYLTNGATLFGFTLTNGVADNGGGVYCESTSAVLSNCVLTGNSAWYGYGGGAYGGTLNNCTLTGNSAGIGGGAYSDSWQPYTLNNCTLTGNSAGWGGGASSCTLNNCILFYNSAPVAPNYDENSSLNYCCTTPMPANGVGNISADPRLASASLLSAESPCIGAGSATYASGRDIDGEAWANPPSIGCDEYHAGAVTGPLTVAISANYTNVAIGFPVGLTAFIEGRTDLSVWEFGDGTVVSNRPYASHAWTAPADYVAALWAFNESYPGGVSATVTVHVKEEVLHYVAASNGNPVAPYTSWATAATNIQDAVDVAGVGDEIVVANGTYSSGNRVVYSPYGGTMTDRVAVDKPLALRSVDGPQATVIEGGSAVGCVYLTNGATLFGFTLTNGHAGNGGGVYCEFTSAVLSNCVLTGNSAGSGGGAYGGTLNNCTLTGNSAGRSPFTGAGGGAYGGTLNNCTLTGNKAIGRRMIDGTYIPSWGGGADNCTLNNCTLSTNSAYCGGGACSGTLNNCTLTANSASDGGGGACSSTLNNCTLTSNLATGGYGGGAYDSTLNNCTVTGNSGWGASSATLNNCIVYFNSDANGGNYDPSSTLNYCCTTPLPTSGVGNISADPQLASASHLSAESPCIGAGSATYASGTDIDGEAWANPPSIGCDEYHARAVTGPLTLSLTATLTNVAVGYPVGLTAFIEGRTDLSVWEFGDGFVQVNEPYTSHTWTAPGDYLVALWAFNESHPEGVSATVTIYVDQGVHYVAATSGSPVAPYTSWATAATNIQDAVDVAAPGTTIFVTNGTYASGGRTTPSPGDGATNRVAVDKPLTVRSMNGPGVTVIQGQMPGATNGDMRCVYLTNAATLLGFTLSNGVAGTGGGVYCESTSAVLSNCVLSGNSALNGNGGGAYSGTLNNCTLTGNSAGWGGGAAGSTLNNCTLSGNSANGAYLDDFGYVGGDGGGAYGSTLNNCTLSGNSATNWGGGAFGSTLNNCIVYFNTATNGANYCQDQWSGPLNYCCTTPMPTNGVGNITNAPLFADQAHGNLRLQSNSPCINVGNNAYVVGSTDLDGRPRILGGMVDMGAYEFQGPRMGEFIGWLQQYGLPTDGSADFTDPDHDGLNNWQEWRCGTCPTNASSALRLLSPQRTGTNVTVIWQSVAGVNYFLECSTNLSATPCFRCVATNLPGQPGTTSYADTNAAGASPIFYRVGVP